MKTYNTANTLNRPANNRKAISEAEYLNSRPAYIYEHTTKTFYVAGTYGDGYEVRRQPSGKLSCTCQASQFQPTCRHRKYYLQVVAELRQFQPQKRENERQAWIRKAETRITEIKARLADTTCTLTREAFESYSYDLTRWQDVLQRATALAPFLAPASDIETWKAVA